MSTARPLSDLKYEDTLDSREITERISDLESYLDEAHTDDEADDVLDARAEIVTLREFAEEASGYAADWQYGETLIRDSYFERYAEELAGDIGAIDPNASWPLTCIDWEQAARELQMDYTSVELDGVTFWTR